MSDEYVDGVRRPKIDHYVRGSRILTWSAVCPDCQSVCAIDYDRNKAWQRFQGLLVDCDQCRTNFQISEDTVEVRDLTDDLRHAQANEVIEPDWEQRYKDTKDLLDQVLAHADKVFKRMPCHASWHQESLEECRTRPPCGSCDGRKDWAVFRKILEGLTDVAEGRVGPGPDLSKFIS